MLNLQKVKELAKKQNISLNDVAARLDTSPQALSRMIKENSTKVSTLEQLSSIFNVSVATFFDEDIDKPLQENGEQKPKKGGVVIIPHSVLEIIAEKDRQIAYLTQKLIEQGKL